MTPNCDTGDRFLLGDETPIVVEGIATFLEVEEEWEEEDAATPIMTADTFELNDTQEAFAFACKYH